MGKLRGIRHKDRISAVQSSQSRGTEQCKKCVQYDFKFTSIYNSERLARLEEIKYSLQNYNPLNVKEFLYYKPSKNIKM